MFQRELQKVKQALKETSDIDLSNEYDALLIKPLASTNLLRENRTGSTKQSHIALSGKDSQDFFPYVDIYHYTDNEFNDQSMKSFYVLQVPVVLNQNNVNYANEQNVEFNFNSEGYLTGKGSVKLSRPGSTPQIELGNTSTSDDVYYHFRKLFYERDFLIVLKKKRKVSYEAYIVKSNDGQRFELIDTVEYDPNRSQSTIVDLQEITPNNDGEINYKEQFRGWLQAKRLKKDTIDWKVSALQSIAPKIWREVRNEVLDFFGSPNKVFDKYSVDDFAEIKKKDPAIVSAISNYKEFIDSLNDGATVEDEFEISDENVVGKNVIYYGAPGTGKSFGITQEIKNFYPNFEDEGNLESAFVFRTTFHPEYTYSDFVGQVMPKVQDDSIKYVFTPGVFTRALERAISLEKINQPVFLVLEELSRANVAAVFGDLFQLLDRKDGKSEYSISNSLIAKEVYHLRQDEADGDAGNKKVYLPKNLFIFGTVNTNDQNVFVMDTAFKRRFEWKYISTKPAISQDGKELNNPVISIGNGISVKWWEFYQKLNAYITREMNLGEDKQVGQFFIQFIDNEMDNQSQVQNKLLQYLWDDVKQASFNGKKLFDYVSNYSSLYERFGNGEVIFHSDFLDSLDQYTDISDDDLDDSYGSDNNLQEKQLTTEQIYKHMTERGRNLVDVLSEILDELALEREWSYVRKEMNYYAFKYFLNDNRRSGFLQVMKGTKGVAIQISLKVPYEVDKVPNSKQARTDRKEMLETCTNVSTIEELVRLKPYIEESWRNAYGQHK